MEGCSLLHWAIKIITPGEVDDYSGPWKILILGEVDDYNAFWNELLGLLKILISPSSLTLHSQWPKCHLSCDLKSELNRIQAKHSINPKELHVDLILAVRSGYIGVHTNWSGIIWRATRMVLAKDVWLNIKIDQLACQYLTSHWVLCRTIKAQISRQSKSMPSPVAPGG